MSIQYRKAEEGASGLDADRNGQIVRSSGSILNPLVTNETSPPFCKTSCIASETWYKCTFLGKETRSF